MIRYATNNGNFSDVATWDGGASIPASGDYVYANGYAVTINADVNIATGTLSTEVCPTTGIGGGSFPFTTSRTIVADIKAGTSTALISTTAGITLTIVGNYHGGSSSSAIAISARAITINVTGDGYGGSGAGAYGINTASYVSVVNQIGNVTGGSGAAAINQQASASTTNVTGNATANVFSAISYGGSFFITGILTASITSPACLATNIGLNTIAYVSGVLVNTSGIMAVCGMSVYLTPASSTAWTFQDGLGSDVNLYTADALENPPDESDVRDGVVYGIGDAYEGTLETGSTPAEFVAALVASDLGLRMAKCAITEEVLTMLENFE